MPISKALADAIKSFQPSMDRLHDLAEKERGGTTLTAAEKSEAAQISAKSHDFAAQIRQSRADDTVRDQAKSLADEIGTPGSSAQKAGGDVLTGRDSGKRLNLKSGAAKTRTAIDEQGGQKALAPNLTTVVGQEFAPDPIPLGRIANSLLDIIPVHRTSSEYAYLRQNSRTINAAIVADGGLKPESPLGLERVPGTLEVAAHVSEPISKYWFVDNDSLQDFVAQELEYGLGRFIEGKVLADINATSGIQTQAFSTSVLQTLRKSLTKIQIAGLEPAAIVLNPTAWEGVELALTTTTAVEYRGIPYDPAARRLWGVPVVVNMTQAAAVGHVIADSATGLATDGEIAVEWSKDVNDSFKRNLLVARCETRIDTCVYQPLGVVKAALAA